MKSALSARPLTLVLASLTGVMLLAGCSGAPDATGSWRISVPLVEASASGEPDKGELVYRADITEYEGGDLGGSLTATNDGYTCEYEILGAGNTPASRINEEGRFTLNLDGECDDDADYLDADPILQGTIEGDEMTGEARETFSEAEAQEVLLEGEIVAFANGESTYLPAEGNFTGERTSE